MATPTYYVYKVYDDGTIYVECAVQEEADFPTDENIVHGSWGVYEETGDLYIYNGTTWNNVTAEE